MVSSLAVEPVFVFLVSSAVAGGFECIRETVIMAASAVAPSVQFRIDFVFLFISSSASFFWRRKQRSPGFRLFAKRALEIFNALR